MSVEGKGWVTRVGIDWVNWQQEEPTGSGGGRQLSMDGTSRVTGDSHARFCERLGVKSPGPTRRHRVTGVPTATLPPVSRPGMNWTVEQAVTFRGLPGHAQRSR